MTTTNQPCAARPASKSGVSLRWVCFVIFGLYYTHQLMLGTVCVAAQQSDTANLNDSTRLRTHIIDANDHRFRPIQNQSAAITVNAEFHLFQILDIDELEGKMKISCAFNFWWRDEIRVWTTANYSGISVLHPDPTDVWRPRIFISNSLGDRDVFKDDYAPLSVLWNGTTRWRPGIILATSCDLDLLLYPLDEQLCHIYAYSSNFRHELEFRKSSATAVIDQYTPNGEWTLLKTKIDMLTEGEGIDAVSFMNISISIKRDPGFFLFNSLLPTMMLSFLSLMVFVLPRNSGERAGYCMTVLLSLSLIQSTVSSQLPQTPQSFPYIVMYLFALLTLSWIIVISTMAVLVWANRHDNDNNDNTAGFLGSSDDSGNEAPMEGKFVPLDSGFTVKDKLYDEALKASYGPINQEDISSNGNKGDTDVANRQKFVFVRDFRRVHPSNADNAPLASDNARDSESTCFQFLSQKLKASSHWMTHDIDVTLFCVFLALWIALSIVFLFLIVLS